MVTPCICVCQTLIFISVFYIEQLITVIYTCSFLKAIIGELLGYLCEMLTDQKHCTSYQVFNHHIKDVFMRNETVLNSQVVSLSYFSGPVLLCWI